MFRRTVATIGCLLLATSCSLGTPDDVSSLNLYVSVDDAFLGDGELMTITVTAQNVGYDPVTLTGPSDCLLYIEVLDTQGGVVYHSSGNCTGGTVTEEVAAGATIDTDIVWNGTNLAGARLSPGYYHLRPVARITGSAYRGPLLSVSLE